MKYRIKENIKNIMQTMLEAHNYIIELVQDGRIEEMRDVLSQCQECAIRIGENIEGSEGEGTKAVVCLETYCEQLYQISIILDKKKIKKLKLQLDESIRCVESEIEEKIEVDKQKIVFMPYKASMWDCMESVWEAAVADPECDTYVVPIPYYERNQDGSAKKICYEGKMFPGYVPIVMYEEFLIEKERPDIIYIHNPYDGANYVTSVHPDYYSFNLKKYTNKLVYIPYYFLGAGPMPEAHKVLPAYQYIDKIVVQDKEKAKSLIDYINEDKITIIGSPKVDRIIKLNKKKSEIIEKDIPCEWREKIKGKKVILFNVSISGLLENSKFAMNKIRYILSEFTFREDIVLLWRPHPLLEATLHSMRPELYEEYVEIKNLFVKRHNGIFDETGDAVIAAVIADAYLGEDSSSLVHYFGVLGKPVFYIDWTILEYNHEDRNRLCFSFFEKEKDILFFVPDNKGLDHDLFQLDLKNGVTERMATIPGLSNNVWRCYAGIKIVDNKIFFIPHNTADIYVYDIAKRNAVKIVLEEFHNNTALFTRILDYKNKLFFIPSFYPAIVSIDTMSLEIREFKKCVSMFLPKKNSPLLFSCACAKREKYLYLAGGVESKILIFDMEKESYEIKKIGNYPFGYGYMIYDGEYFWLSAYEENCIVRWDEKTGDTIKYKGPKKEQRRKDEIWSILLNSGDEVIVCDGHSLDITFINKQTGELRKEESIEDMLAEIKGKAINENRGFLYADFLDTETIILVEERSVNTWNLNTKKWRSYICQVSTSEMLNLERRLIEKQSMVRSIPYNLSENEIGIPQYIDYIANSETDAFNRTYECYQEDDKESIGMRVHEYIKK